ncbi:MAG: Maf family protein [Terrimicrobiaceae bacterium]|nr:Maf family protein [Terrimicrobiaceae bacterium]
MLASRSPRRRELLAQAGFITVCEPADVEEVLESEGPPAALAIANAELKAMSVALVRPEDIVLGADTIVVLDGEIFGKPRNIAHAEEMLDRMAGRVHEVITGVCLVKWARRTIVKFSEVTRVRFRPLAAAQIREYLASIDPLDKAGAYAAQEDGGRLIECAEGSFSNVVGLPMERTVESLARHFAFPPRNP